MLPPVGEGPQSKGSRKAPPFCSQTLRQTFPGQKGGDRSPLDIQGLSLLRRPCPVKNLPGNITLSAGEVVLELVGLSSLIQAQEGSGHPFLPCLFSLAGFRVTFGVPPHDQSLSQDLH